MSAGKCLCLMSLCAAALCPGCAEQTVDTMQQPAARHEAPPRRSGFVRQPLRKPPVMTAAQAQAAERATDLLLENRFEEALEVCRSFPDDEPFQYLAEYVKHLQARAKGEKYWAVHPKTGREFFEYCVAGDCPNELVVALLKDLSYESLAYPLMELLERRAEDGVLATTPALEDRLLAILRQNEPRRVREAVEYAVRYWEWDKDREVFFALRNAIYAVKVMGYLRDPRFIEPLREQFAIYGNDMERPLSCMNEALRFALRRLGVKDLEALQSESR